MCSKCGHAFLAVIILVFSFWWVESSKWIIIVCAAIILIWEILMLAKVGCSGYSCGKKTGSEIFMQETDEELHEGPSEKELKETLTKKKRK